MAKPIHLDMVGRLTQRERLWQAARKLREFTLMEWQDATKPVVRLETVETYLRCLKAGDYLVPVDTPRQKERGAPGAHGFAETRYRLAKDCLDAPRLNARGEPVTRGLANLAMWRAMRALKEFDWRDIHKAANLPPRDGKPGLEVSELTAKTYVARLALAGYFKQLRPAVAHGGPERGATPARFRLVRDTGALPPAVTKRRVVYDRNLGEFTHQDSEQEVVDGIE